jgi:hypothetical protein
MLNHANEEIKGVVEATIDEIKLMSADEYEDYCARLDQAYQP